MAASPAHITGVAAGVPFVAVPPATGPSAHAPTVVAWHLQDPPRTEAAFAAALPLDGLDAWRIYLGLPMSGSRTPPGGAEELMRLGYEDAVLNLHGPITTLAAEEFGGAFADLRERLDLGDGPIGVLAARPAPRSRNSWSRRVPSISAAVLVSPVVQVRKVVEALARHFDFTYPWSDPSLEVARRLDFLARADEIVRRGEPAVLLVVGADDDAGAVGEPAAQLRGELARRYADAGRAELVVVPGMGHALADEPGIEPAPQTPHAAEVDAHAVRWLQRHLTAPRTEDG